MARIYSAVLGLASSGAGTTSGIIGTVPTGEVWVLRSVAVQVPATLTGTYQIRVSRSGVASVVLVDLAPAAAASYTYGDYRINLATSDRIDFARNLTGTGTITVWASGYRLVALP